MVPTGQEPTLEERRERKKSQNRLNQRARRQRIKDQEDTDTKTQKKPFRIERWRLDDGPGSSLQTSRPVVLTSETAANDRHVLDHGTTQLLQPQKCSESRGKLHQRRSRSAPTPRLLNRMRNRGASTHSPNNANRPFTNTASNEHPTSYLDGHASVP
ncbi:hypothetical protein FOQG_18786 [Fusarium oxysporum f. sp. raphani 54005]|uniref:BZIP domain-containing protein n=1 Tax=Fusarium oxysporum f. sp. raphani 54005 TaxID=1089458 RepID=X0B2W1_FUSOX|nr:hypothetical protein FOQG_18786 [Fusarium oxysporum f. sp. raphani 54005]